MFAFSQKNARLVSDPRPKGNPSEPGGPAADNRWWGLPGDPQVGCAPADRAPKQKTILRFNPGGYRVHVRGPGQREGAGSRRERGPRIGCKAALHRAATTPGCLLQMTTATEGRVTRYVTRYAVMLLLAWCRRQLCRGVSMALLPRH